MKLKQILKQVAVKILLIAGALKLGIYYALGRASLNADFVLSVALFLAFIVLSAHLIFKSKKIKLTMKSLFFSGYIINVAYNWILGALNFAPAMSTTSLLLSGLDLAIIAVVVGFIGGVKK